jgi:diguanylate cyclase (GGDEF)-like protein
VGSEAETRLDNVIGLGITTGDSNVARSVDIRLKKAQLKGKWITAQNLYLILLLSWIATITVNGGYRLFQLSRQLKSKREQTAELEQSNAFLSIQKNEYEELAKTDPLTGVANRAGIREILQDLQHPRESDHSLIMFDIDNFKEINDNYGHETGDAILRKLAGLVTGIIRDSDHFARWGGEEFIILCANTSLNSAKSFAEKLRQLIAAEDFIEQQPVTCSFGVSAYEKEGKHGIKRMFESADAAMYKAKKGGRNRIEVVGTLTTRQVRMQSLPDDSRQDAARR